MSQIWPSPMQAAAAISSSMKTVMSWQPYQPVAVVVLREARLADDAGLARVAQRDLDDRDLVVRGLAVRLEAPALVPVGDGASSLRRVRGDVEQHAACRGSGTSVWVCEPQSVGTPVIRAGVRGLETSKMRMPSKPGRLRHRVAGRAGARRLDRDEQQVPPHRDVVLRARTREVDELLWLARVRRCRRSGSRRSDRRRRAGPRTRGRSCGTCWSYRVRRTLPTISKFEVLLDVLGQYQPGWSASVSQLEPSRSRAPRPGPRTRVPPREPPPAATSALHACDSSPPVRRTRHAAAYPA